MCTEENPAVTALERDYNWTSLVNLPVLQKKRSCKYTLICNHCTLCLKTHIRICYTYCWYKVFSLTANSNTQSLYRLKYTVHHRGCEHPESNTFSCYTLPWFWRATLHQTCHLLLICSNVISSGLFEPKAALIAQERQRHYFVLSNYRPTEA